MGVGFRLSFAYLLFGGGEETLGAFRGKRAITVSGAWGQTISGYRIGDTRLNRKSKIKNQKSKIENLKSKIENPKSLPSALLTPDSSKRVKIDRTMREQMVSPATIEDYLDSRPRSIRWREWLSGRRYRITRFQDRATPLVTIAHAFRDAAQAHQIAEAVERDWTRVPENCRDAYDEILLRAPGLVVVQLRRSNVCGCLGHRHVVVKEAPFSESHEAFGGATVGEMDIAYQRVESWQALPLTDTALDTKFLTGTRLEEFHTQQFRLRILSVLLHETNHLVFPQEPETSVRDRSLSFYREGLGSYVENTVATLALTIDRSFSRFG